MVLWQIQLEVDTEGSSGPFSLADSFSCPAHVPPPSSLGPNPNPSQHLSHHQVYYLLYSGVRILPACEPARRLWLCSELKPPFLFLLS